MAEEKKEPVITKAKFWSLMGKITGAIIIIGGHFLKWFGKLPGATSGEIMACGFGVMGIFGTVDINLMIDKFLPKKEE